MTSKTKAEVIDRVKEFLESEADVNGKLHYWGETDSELFFAGTSNDGVREEILVTKEDGIISSRPVGEIDWTPTGIECDCFRVCTHCKELMIQGYVIADGEEYFCSDEHLHTTYTKEEYEEMHDDGEGDSYWTQW